MITGASHAAAQPVQAGVITAQQQNRETEPKTRMAASLSGVSPFAGERPKSASAIIAELPTTSGRERVIEWLTGVRREGPAHEQPEAYGGPDPHGSSDTTSSMACISVDGQLSGEVAEDAVLLNREGVEATSADAERMADWIELKDLKLDKPEAVAEQDSAPVPDPAPAPAPVAANGPAQDSGSDSDSNSDSNSDSDSELYLDAGENPARSVDGGDDASSASDAGDATETVDATGAADAADAADAANSSDMVAADCAHSFRDLAREELFALATPDQRTALEKMFETSTNKFAEAQVNNFAMAVKAHRLANPGASIANVEGTAKKYLDLLVKQGLGDKSPFGAYTGNSAYYKAAELEGRLLGQTGASTVDGRKGMLDAVLTQFVEPHIKSVFEHTHGGTVEENAAQLTEKLVDKGAKKARDIVADEQERFCKNAGVKLQDMADMLGGVTVLPKLLRKVKEDLAQTSKPDPVNGANSTAAGDPANASATPSGSKPHIVHHNTGPVFYGDVTIENSFNTKTTLRPGENENIVIEPSEDGDPDVNVSGMPSGVAPESDANGINRQEGDEDVAEGVSGFESGELEADAGEGGFDEVDGRRLRSESESSGESNYESVDDGEPGKAVVFPPLMLRGRPDVSSTIPTGLNAVERLSQGPGDSEPLSAVELPREAKPAKTAPADTPEMSFKNRLAFFENQVKTAQAETRPVANRKRLSAERNANFPEQENADALKPKDGRFFPATYLGEGNVPPRYVELTRNRRDRFQLRAVDPTPPVNFGAPLKPNANAEKAAREA